MRVVAPVVLLRACRCPRSDPRRRSVCESPTPHAHHVVLCCVCVPVKSASGFDDFLDPAGGADVDGVPTDDGTTYLTDFVILGSTIAVTAPLMGLVARSLVWPPMKAFYRKWRRQLSQQRMQQLRMQKLALSGGAESTDGSGGADSSSSSLRPRARVGSRDLKLERRRDKLDRLAQAQRRREERDAAQAKAEADRRAREKQKELRRRKREEQRLSLIHI